MIYKWAIAYVAANDFEQIVR